MSERAAGILMPISSLPSEYGIGCFSKSAYEFVDWLKKAGQSYWQILPLGPVSVIFYIRGEPIFHQSGGTGGRRCSDKGGM